MKKYFYIAVILFTFFSSNSNSQWIQQYVAPGFAAYDVRFINKSTGWVCGGTRIFKTSNSGMNWIEQPNPAQSLLFQIHPVNEQIIYAAGYCTILKTTNGGENWMAIRIGSLPCPQLPLLTGLWFINENTGWFCSDRGYIIRTIDGCNTFTDSVTIKDGLFDIHFKDSTTGVASSGARTFRSTNSGINWYEVPLPHGFVIPNNYRLSFVGDTGWTAGSNSVVWKTTNYGIIWDSISRITNEVNHYTRCIEFSSALTGYAAGRNGKVFKSTDGGYEWRPEPTTQFGLATYGSIYAYNDSIIWVTGGLGYILYTATGGLTTIEQNKSHSFIDYELFQNYPNPFNPKTVISYQLPVNNMASLIVYDILGKEVSVLVNEKQFAGEHNVEFDGSNLSSGIYFYRLQANNFSSIKKMLLLK